MSSSCAERGHASKLREAGRRREEIKGRERLCADNAQREGNMKIFGSTPTTPSRRVKGTSAAGGAGSDAAAPVSAAESSFFRGIPESELTPRVRQALISLIEEMNSLREELNETRQRMQELENLADTDPLLGIYNRRAFARELSRTLAMVERYGTPASLVFADLDNLKIVNDEMGHGAGDAALSHVASVLKANIRETDSLGRLGGDEFGIILLQADESRALDKAGLLSARVSEDKVLWKDYAFTAHISCGVVEIKKGWTVDDALHTADNAMYQVKKRR